MLQRLYLMTISTSVIEYSINFNQISMGHFSGVDGTARYKLKSYKHRLAEHPYATRGCLHRNFDLVVLPAEICHLYRHCRRCRNMEFLQRLRTNHCTNISSAIRIRFYCRKSQAFSPCSTN